MSETIPNFLLPKPSRRFNPYSNWKDNKDRDIILTLNENIERWEAHPEGVIIDKNGSLLVNGEDVQYERERERNVARS